MGGASGDCFAHRKGHAGLTPNYAFVCFCVWVTLTRSLAQWPFLGPHTWSRCGGHPGRSKGPPGVALCPVGSAVGCPIWGGTGGWAADLGVKSYHPRALRSGQASLGLCAGLQAPLRSGEARGQGHGGGREAPPGVAGWGWGGIASYSGKPLCCGLVPASDLCSAV